MYEKQHFLYNNVDFHAFSARLNIGDLILAQNSKEYHQNYYKTNKAKLDIANSLAAKTSISYQIWKKAYMKEYNKTYTEKNRAKYNAKSNKRHAAKLQRTPKWLTPLHYQQIEMFYESSTALSLELGIPMNVDHIVPLQGKNVSGLHVPWNLQVISKESNNKKRNTFPIESINEKTN
jgi:5-methylcytosine-specific restriction endonuclease McrA